LGNPAWTFFNYPHRCRPRRNFERNFFGTSQKRRTSKKPNAKNIGKSCSYRQNENVPTAFKQYKIQGNVSNLVQSHFGSPPLKEVESGIAPLVPQDFDPAYWGLIHLPTSPQMSLFLKGLNTEFHHYFDFPFAGSWSCFQLVSTPLESVTVNSHNAGESPTSFQQCISTVRHTRECGNTQTHTPTHTCMMMDTRARTSTHTHCLSRELDRD